MPSTAFWPMDMWVAMIGCTDRMLCSMVEHKELFLFQGRNAFTNFTKYHYLTPIKKWTFVKISYHAIWALPTPPQTLPPTHTLTFPSLLPSFFPSPLQALLSPFPSCPLPSPPWYLKIMSAHTPPHLPIQLHTRVTQHTSNTVTPPHSSLDESIIQNGMYYVSFQPFTNTATALSSQFPKRTKH